MDKEMKGRKLWWGNLLQRLGDRCHYIKFMFKKLFSLYHTSHDSVSVVRTTFKVYGKRQNLTFCQPKIPEPIVTKFEWRDYVVDAYHQTKFGLNPPRGFCSPYRWITHPSCSKFTTLFWFLNSPTGESVKLIFTFNTSNDAVLRKEVPFYCYKIKILFFTYLFEKFERKKLQWHLWGKFNKNFKLS